MGPIVPGWSQTFPAESEVRGRLESCNGFPKTMPQSTWSLSPYPDARDFAFTIVHDADDTYSRRLAPLFEVFDRYHYKLTVTAFAFWADWANKGEIWREWKEADPVLAPKAVPLEDPEELRFFKDLATRGHEIGLHTASDGHDSRDEIIRAFEFFKAEFGHYPSTYVEHRDNLQNHQLDGASPDSPFFITDLLNRYRPWVWVVSPSALPYGGYGRYFDLMGSQQLPGCGFPVALWGTFKEFLKTRGWDWRNGELFSTMLRGATPFDHYVRRKYGLLKAFRRSGRRQKASGDGFLEWYSEKNVESLERHGGLALVYTHLNTKWYDRETGRMRPAIESRLASIASKNVWQATASTILDRFVHLEKVALVVDGSWVKIANGSDVALEQLTLNVPSGSILFKDENKLEPNTKNKVVVGTLKPNETMILKRRSPRVNKDFLENVGSQVREDTDSSNVGVVSQEHG